MSSATIERPTEVCRTCGMSVVIGKRGPARIALEPTPAAGGLYSIEQHGRLVRRHLVDLSDEARAGTAVHGGGYVAHVCARRDTDEGLAWYQR